MDGGLNHRRDAAMNCREKKGKGSMGVTEERRKGTTELPAIRMPQIGSTAESVFQAHILIKNNKNAHDVF